MPRLLLLSYALIVRQVRCVLCCISTGLAARLLMTEQSPGPLTPHHPPITRPTPASTDWLADYDNLHSNVLSCNH